LLRFAVQCAHYHYKAGASSQGVSRSRY